MSKRRNKRLLQDSDSKEPRYPHASSLILRRSYSSAYRRNHLLSLILIIRFFPVNPLRSLTLSAALIPELFVRSWRGKNFLNKDQDKLASTYAAFTKFGRPLVVGLDQSWLKEELNNMNIIMVLILFYGNEFHYYTHDVIFIMQTYGSSI